MGENPADTEREIGALRADATAAIEELKKRVQGGVRGVVGGDADSGPGPSGPGAADRAQAAAQAAREQVAENRPVAGAVAALALLALLYVAYTRYQQWRESRKPQSRLKRSARKVQEAVREDVKERVENARKLAEEARRRGLLVRVERDGNKGGQYVRITGARLDLPEDAKGARANVLKKFLWAAMLALFMAVGSVVARRVAGGVWRATIREDPPTEKP